LADLVDLCLAAVPLQVDPLFYTVFSKDMVAASNPLLETQAQQQLAKAVELNI